MVDESQNKKSKTASPGKSGSASVPSAGATRLALQELRDHLSSRVKATADLKQHWLMRIPLEQVKNPPEDMMRHFTAHGENIAFEVVVSMLDKILKGGDL